MIIPIYLRRTGENLNNRMSAIIQKIHAFFREKNLRLSVAESCTGGLVSHSITNLPGASAFFEAGIVSYSAAAKEKMLGVSSETVARYGVVSEQVVREMAKNIRGLTGTDFSLATSGNLGPNVLEGKAKGLVYIAVCSKEEIFSKELRLKGNREENKEEASRLALEFLMEIAEG
jgi:nicotinamide-nucleotide amidase